jgi:hypothetical protein
MEDVTTVDSGHDGVPAKRRSSSNPLAVATPTKLPAKHQLRSTKGGGVARTPKSAKVSTDRVTKRKPKATKNKVNEKGMRV